MNKDFVSTQTFHEKHPKYKDKVLFLENSDLVEKENFEELLDLFDLPD